MGLDTGPEIYRKHGKQPPKTINTKSGSLIIMGKLALPSDSALLKVVIGSNEFENRLNALTSGSGENVIRLRPLEIIGRDPSSDELSIIKSYNKESKLDEFLIHSSKEYCQELALAGLDLGSKTCNIENEFLQKLRSNKDLWRCSGLAILEKENEKNRFLKEFLPKENLLGRESDLYPYIIKKIKEIHAIMLYSIFDFEEKDISLMEETSNSLIKDFIPIPPRHSHRDLELQSFTPLDRFRVQAEISGRSREIGMQSESVKQIAKFHDTVYKKTVEERIKKEVQKPPKTERPPHTNPPDFDEPLNVDHIPRYRMPLDELPSNIKISGKDIPIAEFLKDLERISVIEIANPADSMPPESSEGNALLNCYKKSLAVTYIRPTPDKNLGKISEDDIEKIEQEAIIRRTPYDVFLQIKPDSITENSKKRLITEEVYIVVSKSDEPEFVNVDAYKGIFSRPFNNETVS